MAERRVSTDFGLMFTPELWPSVRKFGIFMGPPFLVCRELATGASSAENHLAKFSVLGALANRLTDHLAEDEAELAAKGHTPATRSKEYAALAEALFCELYSALDGVRRTLFGAYRKVRGVQNDSTERLFKRAKENKYGSGFPEDIRVVLASAFDTWFPRLRRIRTEVTHGQLGSCHLDSNTQKIVYMHGGLGSPTRAFVVEDVVAELNGLLQSVSGLIETVYQSLFAKLEPVPRTVLCGVFKGRCYQRTVAPSGNLCFHSGHCVSTSWFEKEQGYECPLRHECGAYQRGAKDNCAQTWQP